MEAISNAGAAIGLLAKDGVVLAAEKKITSKVWLSLLWQSPPSSALAINFSAHPCCSCWTRVLLACGGRRCTSSMITLPVLLRV